MSQKRVIHNKSKYRVDGYLNHKDEIVIQARLDAQIHDWMMQDTIYNHTFTDHKENEVCVFQDDVHDYIDMDKYRMQRSKSEMLNTYLINEIALFMLLLDMSIILILQIYMNWSSQYTFKRGFYIAIMILLSIHVLYCMSIYVLEKYKDYHNDIRI